MTNRTQFQLPLILSLLALSITSGGCHWHKQYFSRDRFADAGDPAYLLAAQPSGSGPQATTAVARQIADDSQLIASSPVGEQFTDPGQPAGATLQVSGVTPGSGPVRVAIFDSAETFPNREAATSKLSADSTAATVSLPLEALSKPSAVAVYQDLNNDGVLNRSALGIPSEPYGFSNNAVGQMGPPSFRDAAIPADSQSVQVNLKR